MTTEPLLVQPESSTNPSDHTFEPERSGGEPASSVAELTSSDFSSSGMELSGTAAEASRSGIEFSRASAKMYRKRVSGNVHWLDQRSINQLDESTTNEGTLSTSESYNSLTAVQPNGGDTSINRERQQSRKNKHEEAALFIRKGENDAKFYHHPKNKWATWAYAVTHYQVYYMIHFIMCIFLMLLAFAETPCVGQPELDDDQKRILVSIHGVLELILLSSLSVNVILHIIWFRSDFIRHRILLITIILVVMYLEALTVVIRQQNHIRITRILRPFFLLDTHYMRSVRRVTRQIVQILKPILNVLLLLIFFILLFGLFGYLFFAETNPDYFSDYSTSCLSLFITTSTANNPDVMMEAYAQHGATAIFFVIYLLVTLYLASNVLLAVVYASFSKADKKKFKKLFCHKRDALRQAFQVITEDRVVQFHDFLLLMQHYRPQMPEWQVFCIFKSLNKDPHGQYDVLDEGDFLLFYEVLDFRWSQVNKDYEKIKWYTQFHPKLVKPLEIINKVVSHSLYKFLVGLVALANFVFLIVVASRIQDVKERYEEFHKVLPGTFIFLIIYILDIIFSILGHGPYEYFRKFWNLVDVIVTLISLISAIISIYHIIWVVVLPLKLLRLIRLRRSYRVMMSSIVDLAPHLLSVFVLMLIIYYCFAIIGMEFLYGKVEQGCCTDALYDVGSFYKDGLNITNPSDISHNVYYLNNFDNILRSYATLFTLMVVNNWYIIMEGFASEVHHRAKWPTRIFFMAFYIITLVVLQVVIAFIVEAFVLKIQAAIKRRVCLKHPKNPNCGCARRKEKKKKKVVITLVEEDLAKLQYEMADMDKHYKGQQKWINKQIRTWQRNRFNIADQLEVHFIGSRSYTKEDIHILHYREEIALWRKERPNLRGSNLELEQLKEAKDKRNYCSKIGNYILDFIIN